MALSFYSSLVVLAPQVPASRDCQPGPPLSWWIQGSNKPHPHLRSRVYPPPDTGGDNHCSSFWLSLKPCFFFCYSGPCKRREMVPAPTFISQTPSRDGHWIN